MSSRSIFSAIRQSTHPTQWWAGWGASTAVHGVALLACALIVFHGRGGTGESDIDSSMALGPTDVDRQQLELVTVELPVAVESEHTVHSIAAPMAGPDAADRLSVAEPSPYHRAVENESFAVGMLTASVGAGHLNETESSEASTEAKSKGGVQFFGTTAEGNSFVFVVDCSSSMHGRRFQRAVTELTRSVSELDEKQSFSVIFYDHRTFPMLYPRNVTTLLPATEEYRSAAIDWLQKVQTGGSTQPAEALQLALSMKPDIIFFLTDGRIPPITRRQVRNWNKGQTAIHTIAFVAHSGAPIMKGIAEDNRGRFRFVP